MDKIRKVVKRGKFGKLRSTLNTPLSVTNTISDILFVYLTLAVSEQERSSLFLIQELGKLTEHYLEKLRAADLADKDISKVLIPPDPLQKTVINRVGMTLPTGADLSGQINHSENPIHSSQIRHEVVEKLKLVYATVSFGCHPKVEKIKKQNLPTHVFLDRIYPENVDDVVRYLCGQHLLKVCSICFDAKSVLEKSPNLIGISTTNESNESLFEWIYERGLQLEDLDCEPSHDWEDFCEVIESGQLRNIESLEINNGQKNNEILTCLAEQDFPKLKRISISHMFEPGSEAVTKDTVMKLNEASWIEDLEEFEEYVGIEAHL